MQQQYSEDTTVQEAEEALPVPQDKRAALIEKIEQRQLSLSFSSLSRFRQSPRHFLDYFLFPKETPSMVEGRLVDCLITQPDRIETDFIVLGEDAEMKSHTGMDAYCHALCIDPRFDDKVPERREYIKAVLANEKRSIVSRATFDMAEMVATNVWMNPASRAILESATEFQKKGAFEIAGWTIKEVQDVHADGLFVADLKLTADAAFPEFKYKLFKRWYPAQAAIYTATTGLPYFLVAFDRGGHVSVIEIPDEMISDAFAQVEEVVYKLEECAVLGDWDKSYDFWAGPTGIYSL